MPNFGAVHFGIASLNRMHRVWREQSELAPGDAATDQHTTPHKARWAIVGEGDPYKQRMPMSLRPLLFPAQFSVADSNLSIQNPPVFLIAHDWFVFRALPFEHPVPRHIDTDLFLEDDGTV